MATMYKRADRDGVWWVRYRGEDGHLKWESTNEVSERVAVVRFRELRDLEAGWKLARKSGGIGIKHALNMGELARRYLVFAEGHYLNVYGKPTSEVGIVRSVVRLW